MNPLAVLQAHHSSVAVALIRSQAPLPAAEPVQPLPPLPPDTAPPPLDLPPQIPPEIRGPDRVGERIPVGDNTPLPAATPH